MAQNGSHPFTIVLLGAPGSGKGTQSDRLLEDYDMLRIDTGAVLRKLTETDTDLGRRIASLIDHGNRLPDPEINEIMEDVMANHKDEKRILLDGYPRSMGQVKGLEKIIGDIGFDMEKMYPIYINVSDEEVIRRIMHRAACARNENGDDCDPKNTKPRKDDTEEGIKVRLSWHKKDVMPVVEHYRQTGELIEIDGEQEIEKVYQDIVAALATKGVEPIQK